ncbi:molybdenum cofactor guanylyltransferase [Paenibacillus antri]|nr:molybdenum cofactor guanylyltransferase [Paenibacillus antri]
MTSSSELESEVRQAMLSGIILAGGPNRRMGGSPKSLLRFGGESLVERQVREMRRLCDEMIVVTDDPLPYLRLLDRNVRIITDYYKAKGPLVGIHAGLMLATHPQAWIVGCDMPYVSADAAAVQRETLRSGAQAAVPHVNGGLYPLHGLYDRSCAQDAAKLIESGETSATALLKHVAWKEVRESAFVERGLSIRFVANVNTKEDYEAIRSELEPSMTIKECEVS